MNIAKTLEPHVAGYGMYPSLFAVAIVANSGTDNQETTGEWVSVTGENFGSLTAHGVDDEMINALEGGFLCRVSIAATETLSLLTLKIETAPPDGSGDPDAGSLVLLDPVDRAVDVITLGATPKTDQLVSFTGSDQDPIVVHASQATPVVDALIQVRLSFNVRPSNGLEFFRLKVTPDLSAVATDTADVLGYYGFVASHVPAYDPKGI